MRAALLLLLGLVACQETPPHPRLKPPQCIVFSEGGGLGDNSTANKWVIRLPGQILHSSREDLALDTLPVFKLVHYQWAAAWKALGVDSDSVTCYELPVAERDSLIESVNTLVQVATTPRYLSTANTNDSVTTDQGSMHAVVYRSESITSVTISENYLSRPATRAGKHLYRWLSRQMRTLHTAPYRRPYSSPEHMVEGRQ